MDKKQTLLNSAKDLFSTLGFKRTNVSKITEKAGMATGTFYNYFESKDEIFMTIYLDENKKLKTDIFSKINLDDNPMAVMGKLMELNFLGMMGNPILKQWYDREVFMKIEENFRESKGLDNIDFLYDDFIKVVIYWQENGRMRADIKPEMIMAIFNALINIDLHKEEIGIEYFPDVTQYVSEFVMIGLMKTE